MVFPTVIPARSFFEQYGDIQNNLRIVAGSSTPGKIYFEQYSCASFKAQIYLDALAGIRKNASIFCGDLLVVKDYRLKRPHLLDSPWDKPNDRISFGQIRRFALEDIPRLFAELGVKTDGKN